MSGKKTILIIEDEPHIVMGLRDALEFEGFAVISAGKGKDGVQLARAESPDAVILDSTTMTLDEVLARAEEIVRSHLSAE